ncbi:hypothetical protein, partial [uncultured Arthrobacter sp.]|uniref:hypothetical protein n=1 Tax=uncultured Arthrobacter sp. TaxID=114050 RepID=UPI0032178DD7
PPKPNGPGSLRSNFSNLPGLDFRSKSGFPDQHQQTNQPHQYSLAIEAPKEPGFEFFGGLAASGPSAFPLFSLVAT